MDQRASYSWVFYIWLKTLDVYQNHGYSEIDISLWFRELLASLSPLQSWPCCLANCLHIFGFFCRLHKFSQSTNQFQRLKTYFSPIAEGKTIEIPFCRLSIVWVLILNDSFLKTINFQLFLRSTSSIWPCPAVFCTQTYWHWCTSPSFYSHIESCPPDLPSHTGLIDSVVPLLKEGYFWWQCSFRSLSLLILWKRRVKKEESACLGGGLRVYLSGASHIGLCPQEEPLGKAGIEAL